MFAKATSVGCIIEVLDRIEAKQREQLLSEPPPHNALDYLQSIYRNPLQPTPLRMRAAIEALPFESPKLSATALSFPGDFAQTLERAILRSGVKMPRMIDAEALPQPE
jgi:hypothetical protein